jgi:hypothetical protein
LSAWFPKVTDSGSAEKACAACSARSEKNCEVGMGKIAMNRSGHGTIEEDTMGEDTGISSGAFYELFIFPS